MKKNYDLLGGDILEIFKEFVTTSTVGMLAISLYILFDTIFIGQSLGGEGLAALNISIPIYNLLFGTGICIGIGSSTIMSINIGHEDSKGRLEAFEHAILLGGIIGLLFSLIGWIFMNEIMFFLGASADNITLVKSYINVIIPFSWSFVMVYNLSIVVRNDNGPKTAMLAMGIGGLTNIIFDYILIFPLKMGMKGAAIATVMSSLVSLSILIHHFISGKSELKLKTLKLQKKLARKIVFIGSGSFIIEISSGIVIFLFNRILLRVSGDIGISAYSIISNITLMVIAIFTGISQGIQPIASSNFGAGKLDRVWKVRRYGIVLAIIFGLVFMIAGFIKPELIISIFTSEKGEFINITKEGIRYYFIAFPIIAINIVMSGYFQSIDRATYSTLISLFRGILFILLGLPILTSLFEIKGIWITIPIAEVLTLLSICIMNFKERKRFMIVNLIK